MNNIRGALEQGDKMEFLNLPPKDEVLQGALNLLDLLL